MDNLDEIADILTKLADSPHNHALHTLHIALTPDISARELMLEFIAGTDDVWLPLLDSKQQPQTADGVDELLALYDRAEADYLSIPILQKHLQFLIDTHALYNLGDEPTQKPAALQDRFSTSWTRNAISSVVAKASAHITKSHLLWDIQRDWELKMLEAAQKEEKPELIDHVQNIHLARLHQPHSNPEDTAQSYSSFTTNYQPPQQYESLLIAASKIRAQGVRAYERREAFEAALNSPASLPAYAQYLAFERRGKNPDPQLVSTLHERAIAEAARRKWVGEAGAEEALRVFWAGYLDALRTLNAPQSFQLITCKRAVRSVPDSGEVWARYMRFLERTSSSDSEEEQTEVKETVPDLYLRALNTKLLQHDVEQLVPIVLARAGYEKRRLEAGLADEDGLATLIGLLENGIEMVHQASKQGDPKYRLEKFLAQVYQDTQLPDSAIEVWQNASKKHKSSYLMWSLYTDILISNDQYDQARVAFIDAHAKQLDWPEAVWESWIAFEHLHGSLEDIESCLDRIERARGVLEGRRAREAEKAAMEYQAAMMAQAGASSVPAQEVVAANAGAVVPMEVDDSQQHEQQTARGTKRVAEEGSESQDGSKKARFEPKPPPLKRDRENCTVFVACLPEGVTEGELTNLFKDCGIVRDVKITRLPNDLVATVEFNERDSIPPALTKDKKRVHDQEIAVHLAWKSTLYVTNFPETADDPYMRNLFGQYGTIFDIRWPSKKFKTTRRFCYIQFISPDAAEKALELHTRELEPGLPINVYISNPERKKERTDQDANEREVYVAGLSRYTVKADLERLFGTYGKVKEVRMAEEGGHAKGYAFIEYEEVKDAQAALAANNYELKKRRIAVTLSDSRVRAKHRSEIGQTRATEMRSRSVHVRGLPPATQEGLLQQVFERIARVKRVEVFADRQEAIVELESAAEAGRLLLRTEPVVFNGSTLEISEDGRERGGARSSGGGPAAMFLPRRAVGGGSRPKAGLGHVRAVKGVVDTGKGKEGQTQDDFRKMLS